MFLKELKEKKSMLKLRELKHRYSYKNYDKKMNNAIIRYKNCKNKKSNEQIKREIKLCREYWGCYPLHYYRYNLYDKKYNLSDDQLKDYVPEFYFYNIFLKKYDSNEYSILLNDKSITESLFKGLNINQANTIGRILNKNIYDSEFRKVSVEEFVENLFNKNINKIFVKPVDGQGGYGIFIFKRDDKKFVDDEGIELNNDFLKNISSSDYIIQEAIIQDKYISNIYDKSVNTFRIATENINGEVRVVCATLRIGKGGKQVDNSAQDGLVLGINKDAGIFNDFASTEEGVKYYNHPDSGFEFKNNKVYKWDEIKKFAEDSARKLPYFTYLGWDIALSINGPIAIETNLGFGIDHYQAAIGGVRKHFKIENPNLWRNFK